MVNKKLPYEGLGTTLYQEERMHPVFKRTSEGLEIIDWITVKEYYKRERIEQTKRKK